ncbi:MAG TPA: twin-arginine translocase subunit TatC [Ilumatobacteraceae bacterium]|nr:twin-arginine translocase subunit TatC [Ilumatobacteraceae bacterium]
MAKTPDDAMTLTEHLAELRVRIIRSALAVVVGAILILAFYDRVLDFITRPYTNLCKRRGPEFCGLSVNEEGKVRLFTLDPLEGLSTRLKIATYGGIILALPVIMWQVWRFIVPALHAKEKRYAIPFVVSSVLLFLLGGFLAYATLERALEFLISWSGEDVEQAFQVSRYVRLVGLMVAAFGVGFLFPVLLVFLQLVGVLTPRTLIGAWRFALVGIFVLAAVITPSGDPISLLALSLPMCVLYFLSILVGWLILRRRSKAEAASS